MKTKDQTKEQQFLRSKWKSREMDETGRSKRREKRRKDTKEGRHSFIYLYHSCHPFIHTKGEEEERKRKRTRGEREGEKSEVLSHQTVI